MSTQRMLVGAVAALAVVLAAGQFRWSSLPDGRVEVSGMVYLDGSPLEGAAGTVVMGLDGDRGAVVAGRIDGRGRYRVDTTHKGDGIAPGRYRVAVTAYRPGADGGSAASLLPKKYELAATSGLAVEVTSEQRQTIDLKLTSK